MKSRILRFVVGVNVGRKCFIESGYNKILRHTIRPFVYIRGKEYSCTL